MKKYFKVKSGVSVLTMALYFFSLNAYAAPYTCMPNGTYEGTCTKITCSGTTLNAKCYMSGNNLRKESSLNLSKCQNTSKSDIANRDGTLTCVQ